MPITFPSVENPILKRKERYSTISNPFTYKINLNDYITIFLFIALHYLLIIFVIYFKTLYKYSLLFYKVKFESSLIYYLLKF